MLNFFIFLDDILVMENEIDSFGTRFRQWRESQHLSGRDCAELLGVSPQTVSSVESGRVGLSGEVLATLARKGADLNWLLTGNGKFLTPGGKQVDGSEFIQVPLLPQRVSAGAGQEMLTDIQARFGLDMTVPAPLKWGKDLKAVEVRGDSMTGINIFHGDIVYFKPGEIAGDGIYIIQVNGEILVKRLEFNHFEQKIRISSENPKYPDRVESSSSQAMTILGKVRGWLHEHPY